MMPAHLARSVAELTVERFNQMIESIAELSFWPLWCMS